jgi:trk system potassium uptake protein TrkA
MAEVLIVGGGRIGTSLTTLLSDTGHHVTLVERDPARVAHLRPRFPGGRLVQGSGTDPDVLEAAGIRRADTVVTVTQRDETNLVVTSLARFEFGVPRTIARVNNPKNAWLYTGEAGAEMGVDVALDQADIIGHLVAEEMSLGEMMTLLKLRRGQYALVEERVHPSSAVAGRTVGEVAWPSTCVLVAILRGPDLLTPRGDTRIGAGDELLAVVHSGDASDLAALLGPAPSAH